MAKNSSNNNLYSNIIAPIAIKSAAEVDGVKLLSAERKKLSRSAASDAQAYITDNNVKMDIFINVLYGYNIPEVVCAVQEKIKADVEKETCYKVEQINVMVVSIIVEEQACPPPIEHIFDDEADDIDEGEL